MSPKKYRTKPLITDENLINFNRTEEELQIFWLYCGFSVQRSRSRAQEALAHLLDMGVGALPFDRIRSLIERGNLRIALESTGIGRYSKLEGFLIDSVSKPLDLREGTVKYYMRIYGIGQTKARFFILKTREGARVAVLDRHILSELRARGYDVPAKPPSNTAEYKRCERYFLNEADKAGIEPARFNLVIWRKRAKVSPSKSNNC